MIGVIVINQYTRLLLEAGKDFVSQVGRETILRYGTAHSCSIVTGRNHDNIYIDSQDAKKLISDFPEYANSMRVKVLINRREIDHFIHLSSI